MHSEWQINQKGHLSRSFMFTNFNEALQFAAEVGVCAESLRHHPRLTVEWGICTVELWTHDVNDVTAKDHALAKLIDKIK